MIRLRNPQFLATLVQTTSSVPPTPAFKPTDIAGVKVWFDAADAATVLANGGSPAGADADVYTWVDKSGNARNATQSTTLKTKRRVASQNGLDTIEFGVSGVTGFTSTDSISGLDGATVFVVMKATLITGYTSTVRYQNADGEWLVVPFNWAYNSSISSPDGAYTSGPANGIVANEWTVLAAVRTRNAINGFANYRNGTFKAAINTANTTLANRTLALGYAGYTVGEPTVGLVAEIIVYNSALSNANRVLVERYLMEKWGITATAYTDTFETYALNADLNTQSGGTNFGVAPYVSRWNFAGALATDAFESYTPGAALNSLSGGTNLKTEWTSAYMDRTNYAGVFAYDSFETYTLATDLNGSNAGQTFTTSGSWAGTYSSR